MSEEFYYVVIDKNDESKTIRNACHMELRSDLVIFWDDRGGQIACIHDWKGVYGVTLVERKFTLVERKVILAERKLISNCTNGTTKKYGYDCILNLEERNLTILLRSPGDVGGMAHVFKKFITRNGATNIGRDIQELSQYLTESHQRILP